MAIKICIANQKGGVGKTTCALNIGDALTHSGYKVLFIDLDPQHNSTSTYGATMEDENTIVDVLKKDCTAEEAIQHMPMGDIIPGDRLLADIEHELSTKTMRELLLKKAIASVEKDYDFIIMDTPPNLGLYLVNSLSAVDGVVVTIKAEQYAVDGLSQIIEAIQDIQDNVNEKLKLYGVLLNMYDSRNALDRDIREVLPQVGKDKGFHPFKTVIRISQDVKKVQSMQNTIDKDGNVVVANRSLFENYPDSNAAIDYISLVKEILKDELKAKDKKKSGRKK